MQRIIALFAECVIVFLSLSQSRLGKYLFYLLLIIHCSFLAIKLPLSKSSGDPDELVNRD